MWTEPSARHQTLPCMLTMVILAVVSMAMVRPTGAYAQTKDCDYEVIPNGYRSTNCNAEELHSYLALQGVETTPPQRPPPSAPAIIPRRERKQVRQPVPQVSEPSAPERSFQVGNPAAQRAQGHELDDAVSAFFWRWLKIIGGGWLAIWLFKRREAIAEWYYSLQPHPASGQVDNAIVDGLPIDGELFATVNQPFDGNKYEITVRNQQADALTKRLRRHEEALRSNSEAILRRKREELLREQEFMKAHEALINAGVDHEIAAAHLEALRKATGQ